MICNKGYVLLISCFLFVALAGCLSDSRPSRSDCIVRVDFDQSIDSIVDVFLLEYLKVYWMKYPNNDGPVVAKVVDSMYFQYSHLCEKKYEITEEIFLSISKLIIELPQYSISRELIVPSIATIEATGEAWKD
ncbi:hypothetical protein AB833_00205 [Chromatiales bacterium (ex Bugula neritina AB1)]|nr:hypothetical protein AB833_00205 [Chromatiales bacterium (ex Bugula neritina AB1)]